MPSFRSFADAVVPQAPKAGRKLSVDGWLQVKPTNVMVWTPCGIVTPLLACAPAGPSDVASPLCPISGRDRPNAKSPADSRLRQKTQSRWQRQNGDHPLSQALSRPRDLRPFMRRSTNVDFTPEDHLTNIGTSMPRCRDRQGWSLAIAFAGSPESDSFHCYG